MSYIQGVSRKQAVLFPDTVDDYIEEDDPARLMDLFIDRLDLQKMGFVRSEPKAEGRPGYSPATFSSCMSTATTTASAPPASLSVSARSTSR